MKLTVRVDNRLRFQAADVPPWVVERLKEQFTHVNPEYGKLQALGYYVGNVQRFYQTWDVRGGEVSLPRGGSTRLREVLCEAGVDASWDVQVCDGSPHAFPEHRFPDGGELAPWQQDCVERFVRRQNCIVRAGTGGGKTSMAIAGIVRIGLTAIVMVWTGALAKQWVERIEQELRIPRRDIGVIGLGKKFELKPITVAMQQTVFSLFERGGAEAQELIGYFGTFMFDELQRAAARTVVAAVEPFRCRYRIGFSADESRVDGKEFLIYDLFGGVEVDVDRAQLADMGFILDVAVRVVVSDFEADWYREEFTPAGTANPHYQDFNALLNAMCADEERNRLVLDTIAKANQDGAVMVFSHRIEHCQRLDTGCTACGIHSGLMVGTGEWSKAFDATKDGLKDGSVRVGIGTFGAIGQAIDVPAVSRGVVATPINNNRQKFGQVRGRMCRANRAGSTTAELYYVLDRRVFGAKPLRNLMAWNKSVTVWDGGRWVDAKAYMANARREASLFG